MKSRPTVSKQPPNASGDDFALLARAAYSGNPRDALSKLLRLVASLTDSYGVVLWLATEGANPWNVIPTGQLFMLGTWFPKNAWFGIHNLDFLSLAGQAVVNRRAKIHDDIRATGVLHCDHPFLMFHNLTQTLVAPWSFPGGEPGAISLYRRQDDPPYSKKESIQKVKRILSILPLLVQASRERARFQLLERVSKAFSELPKVPSSNGVADPFKKALRAVIHEVSKTFHSLEAVILLRAEASDSTRFRPWATVAPPFMREKFAGSIYRPRLDENSFTSLCLAAREPVRVLDLSKPEQEVAYWQERCPGFMWNKTHEIACDARRALGLGATEELPPVSFMVVPILSGNELIGAIRCWVARPGLAYFSDADERLLEIVAEQVARAWEVWQRQVALEVEGRAWMAATKAFASKLTQDYEHTPRRQADNDEAAKAIECLKLVDEVFADSTANDIRLLDKEKGELYFAYIPVRTGALADIPEKVWEETFSRRYPLNASLVSLGVRAFKDREVKLEEDTTEEATKHHTRLPGVTRVLAAPIMAGDECYGVLTIRGGGFKRFAPFAKPFALALAGRLGMELRSIRHDSQVEQRVAQQQAEREKILAQREIEVFRDINHQMKGSLLDAKQELDRLCLETREPKNRRKLSSLGACLNRAIITSASVRIFSQLSRSDVIVARLIEVSKGQLLARLKDVLHSAQMQLHPYRQINCCLDSASFRTSFPSSIEIDEELLFHAISNVLDNAVKYSYPKTEIWLRAYVMGDHQCCLSITNRGFPITAAEIGSLTLRGYRGQQASLATGEGSGLGLWITQQIMQAMNGQLEIKPTTKDGMTEIQLLINSAQSSL